MSRKKRIKRIIFAYYAWLNNMCTCLMEIMPPFIRSIIFKIILGRYGESSYIDYKVHIRYPSRMYVGSNTTINRKCSFFGSFNNKSTSIKIGNNVAIAPFCTFYSATHDYSYLDLPDCSESIIVEDNVWIGGRSVILPGVTIGEGAVIGAGSVVTRNIPRWSIAVGNPAKVIKKRKIKEIY